MTAPGQRYLPVPEGLDGERRDAALARMFGLSRSRAAELISDGMVLVDGHPAAKSDRVAAGEPLEVTLPVPRPAGPARPSSVACSPAATPSPPAGPPNARASCTGWMRTRPA